MEDSQSVYDVNVLIEDLRSDQSAVRVASMKRLKEIAGVFGVQRTRDELLPFLYELIDSDDEVLVVMAEQLGDFIPLVGGSEYTEYVLDLLEKLCTMQEVTVREAATQSMLKICDVLTPEEINEYITATAIRMHNGEWFTSKICVCSLLPILYKIKHMFGDSDTVVDMYDDLCKDNAPMIRKAAISVIPEFIKVMDKESCKINLPRNLYLLVRDDQDSIRICGNTSCIALGSVLSEQDRIELILPLFLELASDSSWRVRYTTVTQIGDICALFPPSIVEEKLLIEFMRLMQDVELEVRTGAASSLSKFCHYLKSETIVNNLIKIVGNLSMDPSEHVRIGLASDILKLCPILGSEYTEKYILPIFTQLLQDVNTKVRLNLLSNFEQIKSVLSSELLISTLLPALMALKSDMDWRVRQSLLNYIPLLAQQLGREVTYMSLRPILCDYTMDSVAAIRDNVVDVIRQLYHMYGDSFADDTIFPIVSDLIHHEKYLYRVTGIHIMTVNGNEMGSDIVEGRVIPMLVDIQDDTVANVRLNVARSFAFLQNKISSDVVDSIVMPVLEKYLKDSDRDVRYYAEISMNALKRYLFVRMAYFLPHLHTAYAVDCAIQDETEKLVVIRFGHDNDKHCMLQDETLMKIADLVKNFVVIYLVDITEVPEFNAMYELYDACTTMFFFRNKHMMIDLGTGNNNKINWPLTSKDEMIAIMETIYRGAVKGRGIVISPFDYSARNKF